jgi:hypothetical protein
MTCRKTSLKRFLPPKVELIIVDGMKRTVQLAQDLKLPYKVDHRWIELEMEEKFIAEFLGKLVHQDISFSSIKIHHPTLEDYFLKMVKR